MSRYIDAEKLALHLSDYALQESPNWGANGYGNQDAYDAINECIKAIDDQPTADVRENIKAQKVIGGGEHDGATCWFECSRCHGTVDIDDAYCKHCGADMRGEE